MTKEFTISHLRASVSKRLSFIGETQDLPLYKQQLTKKGNFYNLS